MIQTLELFPGITLRCYPDDRFKHGCLSVQLVRPMCRREAAMNALLPAVLLRGCRAYPDLRSITNRLDELYGASVSTLVRRVGDYQTTGIYLSFVEDRFAMAGDEILRPAVQLLEQLLLEPALENGVFRADFVAGEKQNLISAIESQRNDKRAYAMEQLIRDLCREDSFGIPRLGETQWVAEITAEALYAHYRQILKTSRIDLFYVGSAPAQQVAGLVKQMLGGLDRAYEALPAQQGLHPSPESDRTEQQEVNQGKLCMGYVTAVTLRDEGFAAMQVLNLVFGGGMTSKLFSHIREKLSLCYAIGSGYHGAKGIVTVSAGIDSSKAATVRQQIEQQLQLCREGMISPKELEAAKQAMRTSLQAVHDSPGSIENYYATAALSGLKLSPQAYLQAVEAVTVQQAAQAAQSLRLHSVYFLKGVSA